MTTLYCLRHGLTDWNREHRIQGVTDTALNAEGREQARLWGESLAGGGLDQIVSSGLLRSRETAAIINETLGLEVMADDRLNEMDWGDWTGLDRDDLRKIYKLVGQQERKGFDFRAQGGESRNEVLMRACDAFLDLADAHPGKSILVVTHNGVLKCLSYALTGLDYLPGDVSPLTPYRLHRFECIDRELAIGELNIEFCRDGSEEI